MAYFQGGDFVELLSAQGKAPAAAWKLQGKISKTFDKGIRGNAFQLDGGSETKMQLPKTASSSLGLAQRFVVIQLLVPFTRSFSVEICFSDFQKVRRRFVVASAFRETARTALHAQLPLNAADVPRDQWMNLVFDLQTLSEVHFPDTGYRSMESVCIGGSCRLKRIFTMKDAPTPSRGSQVVRHADIRDIPRQFVFSATQRGASGALPLPTLYFAMESVSGIGVHGVAVATNINNSVASSSSTPKSSRRSQTAPGKAVAKQPKGVRVARPGSQLVQRKVPPQPQGDPDTTKANGPGQQRLRTPARGSITGSKLRKPQSRLGQVVAVQKDIFFSPAGNSPLHQSSRGGAIENQRNSEILRDDSLSSVSPIQVNKSHDAKKEEMAPPVQSETASRIPDRASSPPSSVHSSVMASPNMKGFQTREESQTLRQSILGEIQQKLASLEDDDARADQRDRELFLRHTSLHSGEWHLQQLRDEDQDLNNDDGNLFSDGEDDRVQLSSSWRRELNDARASFSAPSPEDILRRSRDDTPVEVKRAVHLAADKDSIFSFPSVAESGTTLVGKLSSRLFDFDSLLQDVKPLTPSLDKDQPDLHAQLEKRIEHAISDADDDADEQELVELLAAKRSARELLSRSAGSRHGNDVDSINEQKQSLPRPSEEASLSETFDEVKKELAADPSGAIDEWVVLEKDSRYAVNGIQPIQLNEDQDWHLNLETTQDGDSDIVAGGGGNALSIDLTSELSASAEGSVHDLGEVGDCKSSNGNVHPESPRLNTSKPESDHDSCKSSQHDDGDDSSFDFEDLVEDAASSDSRNEDEKSSDHAAVTVLTDKKSFESKPAMTSARRSKDFASPASSSTRGNQFLPEIQNAKPDLPAKMVSVKSPLMDSPRRTREKFLQRKSREQSQKASRSSELSSSFSSRRLQRLLESTDWTAELDAQASVFHARSPHVSPFTRSSDRKYNPANYRSPASSADARRSAINDTMRRPSQKTSLGPQTQSTSSIELVYDPLLRCYYDPVSNKYYALAE
ncbi:hypothetical protein ON010_g576 [Phytophthora cinnamomi]|nr:hypothetical protein ON010_g576 [Phytophthora cinnamomi]